MVVGIDVHKRTHVAALVDERGGTVGTLGFANSPEGMRRLQRLGRRARRQRGGRRRREPGRLRPAPRRFARGGRPRSAQRAGLADAS